MSSQASETSKSELELAYEYSECLAESEDEDDRMLKALSQSLTESSLRRQRLTSRAGRPHLCTSPCAGDGAGRRALGVAVHVRDKVRDTTKLTHLVCY